MSKIRGVHSFNCIAFQLGQAIEFLDTDGQWRSAVGPIWSREYLYRLPGRDDTITGDPGVAIGASRHPGIKIPQYPVEELVTLLDSLVPGRKDFTPSSPPPPPKPADPQLSFDF